MNTLELSQEQIELKRRLDEDAEKEEIKSFDQQIEALDKLSFAEAKRLYEIANNSDFDSIREAYIKWIVSGTLYVLDEFINNNKLVLLENSKYDIDDIRSALIETWIEMIKCGRLINAYSFKSMMHEKEIYNKLYKKLGEKYWPVKKYLGLTTNELGNSLLTYLDKRYNGEEVSHEDIIESVYSNGISTTEKEQIMLLFDSIYKSLTNNELEELIISPFKVKKLIKLLINRELQEELSENVYEDDPYEPILQEIQLEHFVEDIDKLTNPKERMAIHKKLGLSGEEVQKNIDSESPSRVRNIRRVAYRRLKRNRYLILKYGETIDKQNKKKSYYDQIKRGTVGKEKEDILFGIDPSNIDVLLRIYDRVFDKEQSNENSENTKSKKEGQKAKKKI